MKHFNFNQSLKNLVNNLKGLFILSLALTTFGVGNVWGAWSGSGQGKQVNGVWYALYDNTERKISPSLLGNHVEYNYKLSAPGSTLTFSAKRSKSTAVGNLRIGQNVGGTWSDIYDKNPNTSYETSGVLSLNVNATDLSFYNDYGSYDRYFKDVKVTMATYFEDPSKSKLDFGSGNINTGSVSQDFTIAWCNTGTITSSLSAHSDVYTISISNDASAGHYGTATVIVTYNRNIKADTHDATLTLTSGSTTKTITLTGTTTKLDPSITWSSDDATFNVDDVLSATNSNGLTVTLSSTRNEQYVNCSGNTATMLEATTGTITITANVTGNDIYNSKSFTKDITITNKEKQYITWNQDFSKLKTTDANKTITLNAETVDKDGNKIGLPVSYELVGDKTGLSLSQNGNTWTLTYSTSACKNTTIVAKQEGNATYAPASNYSLPVKVVDPTQICSTEETVINSSIKLENTSTYYNIDIPSSMTINVSRSKTGWLDIYTNGFDVELYSGANATGNRLHQFTYSENDINNSKTISLSNLDIKAKSVKLISHASKGYTVSSLSYTHYKYCNTDKTALNYNTYPNTTTDAQTFTISSANYPIEIECSTNKLQIDKSSFGDCGIAGEETINVTYTTGANTGKETEYIYVKDNTGAILRTITVTVSIQKVSQNITSTSIVSSYKTTDRIELSATSNSGLTYFEYSCSPADVATFDGNVMTFNKSCDNLSIIVTQPGDDVYSTCSTTINNITVSKVPPTISTNPTATITYGQKLNAAPLNGGAAKVNPFRGQATNHSVEGSFAWTNGEYTVVETGGTTHEYDVIFTPSGDEAGMYNNQAGKATVTVNKATPTLTTQNPADTKIYIDDTLTPKIDLVSCITDYSVENDAYGHTQNRSAITYTCEQIGAVIADKKFYATVAGTYTVIATAPATDYYEAVSETITIVVGKHTPVITWKKVDHIYAGQILENVASTSFLGNPEDLELTYTTISGDVVVDGNKLHVGSLYTEAHNAKIQVTTTETDYFAQTSSDTTYFLEVKALPKFYLNGEEMPTSPATTNLVLKIGETANVSFDQIVEADFSYTTNAQLVTYEHNSANHTGVITAIAPGDEGFQFHQAGTTTVFDRICQMHIWVKKHEVELSSPIHDNDVWMVDSIYTGPTYSATPASTVEHPQENVVVESSDESVIRHMSDGSWKAVGAGTATLTIRQLNNNYWTGDTITRTIVVKKYTPEITWNIESASYAWGSIINTPVSSTNTDIPFTITSNNPSVANYINGRIEVYNTTGTVTFTFTQEGNYKWNAATTNLTKSFTTFQPNNHVPFTLTNDNNSNFYSSNSGTYKWSNGYKIGNGGINTFNKNTSSVTIRFTGVPDKLSFTKEISNAIGFLPGDGDCNCYVYESADGNSWSQCYFDKERVESKEASNIQLQPTTRYLKFEYKESCLYCTYSNITVTERSSIEPQASSLDFGTGYNGNTAAKRTVVVDWYSVMSCTATISGADASQFYLADDSKTIPSALDNSGSATLSVFYRHEANKSHAATLTITSADTPAKTATINLAGTTERAPQEIIWREDITPLPHNGGLYEGAALASSGGEVVLTSDDENIVKVVNGGLQPVGVGTTTVHASQAGDDIKWQPVNDSKVIEVTSLSVQHLIWNDQLNNIKRSEGNNVNITLTAQSDAIASDPTLVVTYELDDAAKAFASVSGNQLTITGWGSGYITAKQVGNANYIAAQKVKPIISRNPDADCKMLAGEYWEEYTLHTIASKEIDIPNGEPATIEFDAKMSITAVGEGMHLDEWYNNSWHEFQYIDWAVMAEKLGSYAHYGPYNLNRQTTKVRLYTNTSATMTRTFKNVEITLVRYLELAQNDMSFAGVDKGAFLDQTFYINYSNLRGTLDVELKNESSNLQIMTPTIGEECGEIGSMVPVTIRCTGNVVGTENNVIVLSNKGQKLEVPVSATVLAQTQNITWNPATDILTTDIVELNATCTSNLPISYSSNNTDVATVQQDGSGNWSMNIIKSGSVTITASQAGNTDWSPAPNKEVVFNISKADPIVTTWATPGDAIKGSKLSTSILTGGEASVEGTFAWQDGNIQVERGNSGYTMLFIPNNTNWYNTISNNIVVPVSKVPQTITWNYTPAPMYCNADINFDATASSGLNVRYESSDPSIAYMNGNHLVIIKGGNVTITAVQDGDDTWAYTSLSKDIEILRWTPNIVIKPVANSMLIGTYLDNATLNGGRAELDSKQVDGSFSWINGSTETINVAGWATRTVVFTPSNPNHYNSITCEVQVEVKKYAPTITQSLVGSAITYGQPLSESILQGSCVAMDNVKYPSEFVEGTYAWLYPSSILNAGNSTGIVRFTPNNQDWYDVVDFIVPIMVNKAHLINPTAIANMLYGQILDEISPINTTTSSISGSIVTGDVSWATSVDLEEYPNVGEHDYPILFKVTDPNYISETLEGICHVIVEVGFTFDGHNGSSDWTDASNWKDNSKPSSSEDKVIVMADAVIINSDITVGAITIRDNVSVTIQEGGVLNVGDYDCVSRKQYGDIIIEEGGELNLSEGKVAVNDFTLKARLDGNKNETEYVKGESGQLSGNEQLDVNGNAYFELALDPSGECSQGWYDFTVPFPVSATTGVQRYENNVLRTNLKCETNYAIMDYHEDVRAEGKYGWKKYHGIMQPGICYSIAIDDVHNVYRFVKTKDGEFNTSSVVPMTATEGVGENKDKGWNAIGNGTTQYVNLAAQGISKVQVYNHYTNSYSPVNIADNILPVGTAVMVQTPENENMNLHVHSALAAPKRAIRTIEEYQLVITPENSDLVLDRLFVSASEDKEDTYIIGHDLAKFDVSKTSVQMWVEDYNTKLCDIEKPLEEDQAFFPLTISAPKAGAFEIKVVTDPEDATIYLTQDNHAIWNLSISPATIDLSKGTETSYGLKLVRKNSHVTTELDILNQNTDVQTYKVIQNNHLYIMKGGKVFNAEGKLVK